MLLHFWARGAAPGTPTQKNVGRNILSLQLVHAPKLMLFHIFDALIGGLAHGKWPGQHIGAKEIYHTFYPESGV